MVGSIISTVLVILFGGLPLLAAILLFHSHHLIIHLIMYRTKTITVRSEEPLEIWGSSLERWAETTLDQDTSLNIQQPKWPSLNYCLKTQSHLGDLSSNQAPTATNIRLKNQWGILKPTYLFNLAASLTLWTKFG